ncbi:MAG TPA: sigma factor, partial [Steroidobacteraceae bacterium]|nr:sigma factor [Steroidobacteraceae bacterium]
EVWFAVVRGAANYQPSAKFTTWLFTIAHNRMVDMIRANHRLQSLDAGDDLDPDGRTVSPSTGNSSPWRRSNRKMKPLHC